MARPLSIDGELLDRFSTTIDNIYVAALDPSKWPTAIQSIASLHDCPQAILLTPSTAPVDGGFVFTHGISAQMLELWGQKYVQFDPWVKGAVEKGIYREGLVAFSDEIVSREELVNSVFYREFASLFDLWNFCTGVIFDGTLANSLDVACSFHSGRTSRPFDELDRKLHVHTIRHLSRALGTMFRLRNAELHLASSVAALNRLDAGVFLFGKRGNVVFANETALALVSAEDGIRLRAGDSQNDGLGWLVADQSADNDLLKSELSEAVAMQPFTDRHFSRGITIQRRSGQRPYLIQIAALTPHNEFSHWEREVFAIGFLTKIDAAKQFDPDVLVRAFHLTKAEVTLAQELISGDPLAQIASRLSISENTVKTQLTSIFDKTQTHRQTQLVKLLMGLASTKAS